MNKDQANYHRMFLNVQNVMDRHTAKWSGVPVILNYKNEYDEVLSRIAEKDEAAEGLVSVKDQKDNTRMAIAVKLVMLSGALQAFAYSAGDTDLANAVKVTKSEIIHGREHDVDPIVRRIVNIAQDNLESLTEYNVTADLLTELLTSLADFNALIGKPREILNQKYVTLDAMDKLFDQANDMLNTKFDNIMKMFIESEPEFYEEYTRAREIVDL